MRILRKVLGEDTVDIKLSTTIPLRHIEGFLVTLKGFWAVRHDL